MNILELDSFNLADTVKFHDRLNPRLWDRNEHLRPEVQDKLMEIARDFQEFLGVPDLDVKDITVSGSNAAYNYTKNSDIDLHVVIDLPAADSSEVYRELFDAKKFQYNAQHNIRIGGAEVELYVQNPNQEHHSQGIYSLLRNAWISVPRRRKAEVDDISTRSKYEDLAARIDKTVQAGDHENISGLMKKIKTMRQSGLEQQGEFGSDNLAFKLLRNNGYIKRLVDARNAARDLELSLDEAKKKKQRVKYGFGGYWSPGFSFGDAGEGGGDGGGGESRMAESPDGVNPTTKMFLDEQPAVDNESTVRQFIDFVVDRLGIDNLPEIVFHNDAEWSKQNHSFGRYTPETHTLEVNLANRHVMDTLRTTAHELVHCRQNQEHQLPDHAGETGSDWENQANAMAGAIMRDYAELNPRMFENASGYIPRNKKEARDPRYSMAISPDVGPGQVGREANKLALNTGRNGEPGLLMKSANLREGRMPQPSQGSGRYQELNKPLGPETPPTMPAGTVRVDVSDVYDWYKLGQHISNMKGLGKHDFGKGPPSSIISFGDEETEHKFIRDLEATGLDVTDIDPRDPNQPRGMRPIKTDPTYNVAENELAQSLRQELALFEDDLFEIRMTPSSLRQEAARTGALAGMEFEMIVPNVEDNDGEMEPDYDFDQRCRSIQDAYDFFYDGDYNGRREVQNMRDEMYENYREWLDDKIEQEWDSQSEEYILEWVKNNVDESEWNPDDLENSPRNEALEDYAANVHADPMSDQYQQARDEFREENQEIYDESDWLDDQGLDYMSNVENTYSMSWPHWTSTGGGEAEISDVAQDFENAIGRDTRASDNYHSGSVSRPSVANQRYIVEPDGSLDGDNPGDRGLEFVSPPLPIDEILSDLKKVKVWAGEYGCYTNSSTGLHINISVPNYSRENLDFVKLALLMGDKYVLDAFGRTGNTYAKSALGIVKDAVRNKPEDAARLLDKMKGNLDQLATKAIHSGITQKYTSINTKDGHIEFRSPGGDWLDENFDKIENTLLRFTVAMSAALNPEMYREEYLKKLYKLLSENNKGDDTIKYFSDYVAGKIPRAALRSFVKQAQLERRTKRGQTGNQLMWWRVGLKSNPNYSIEVVGSSPAEAIYKAMDANTDLLRYNSDTDFTTKPLRPYQEQKPTGPTVGGRPSNPQGGWVISPENDRSRVAYRFAAAGFDDANVVRRQWAADNEGVWIVQRDDNQTLGQPGATQSSSPGNPLRPTGPGPWELYDRNNPAQAGDAVEINGQPVTDREQALSQAAVMLAQRDQYGSRQDFGVRTIATGSRANIGTQTDMENRLGWGSQSDDANYEVVDRQTLQPVFRFIANTPDEANRKYGEWLAAAGLPQTTQDYAYRDLGWFGTNPTASINYELYNRLTDQVIDTFPARNDREALTRLSDYRQFGAGQSSPDHFGVRRGPGVDNTVQTTDQQQGGIIDVEPNVAQNFGSGTFSGTWRVVNPDGEELYRFSGVGNNQGDANRVALDWLRRNPRHMQTGVEVVPVMTESVAEGQDLAEIENIPAYVFTGGKDILDTHELPAKKKLRPLPGGTDLLYAVDQDNHGQRVSIVDPGMPGVTQPQVVAVLHLDPVHYLPNTVQVGSITVDEDYRGRGLARALYGIVFTVMRKNLLSGDSQTPGGRKNWLGLAAIPGVEVHGLVRIPHQVFDMNKTAVNSPQAQKYADRVMDQIMELGGQFFSKNNNSTYWLFDVVPGKGSLQPAVKNSLSKLYGYDAVNLLLASWSGA